MYLPIMGTKRDNAYYEGLLRRRAPSIYSDFKAGKIAPLQKALIAAGIKKPDTPLAVLKRAWRNATATERAEFLAHIGSAPSTKKGSPSVVTSGSLIDKSGLLLPSVAAKIQKVMRDERMRPADACVELGFNRHDYRWRRYYERQEPLKPEFLGPLRVWLAKHT